MWVPNVKNVGFLIEKQALSMKKLCFFDEKTWGFWWKTWGFWSKKLGSLMKKTWGFSWKNVGFLMKKQGFSWWKKRGAFDEDNKGFRWKIVGFWWKNVGFSMKKRKCHSMLCFGTHTVEYSRPKVSVGVLKGSQRGWGLEYSTVWLPKQW